VVLSIVVVNSGLFCRVATLAPNGLIHSNLAPEALVFNTKSSPSQIGLLLVMVGISVVVLIESMTIKPTSVQPLELVTVTPYCPLFNKLILLILGLGKLELKLFGPDHS